MGLSEDVLHEIWPYESCSGAPSSPTPQQGVQSTTQLAMVIQEFMDQSTDLLLHPKV